MAIEDEKLFLDLSQNSEEGSEGQGSQEGQGTEGQSQEGQGSEGQGSQEGQQEGSEGQGSQEEKGSEGQGSQEQGQEVTINESQVLKVLSEKLGREINSFDDLTKTEEKQLNPQIKAIADWADKTGRPVEDWVKFNKDYSKMSDVEKAREILSLKYPSFTDKEVELELNKYLESEDDLEEDITLKTLELKKLISNDGKLLEDLKLELGSPIEGYKVIPEEIQAEVEFAKAVRDDYNNAIEYRKNYNKNIESTVLTMTGLEIDLQDGLKINYNMSPEDKKELPTFLSEMPHWRNPDGSDNYAAITSDALKIKNFEKIISMVYQQGLAAGSDKLLQDANNITLGNRQTTSTEQPDGGNKGIVVEGLERLTGQGTRVRYGRKK